MATILTVILAAISVLMVFLIMLQEGKGGGLAALGGTKAAAIEGVTNPIRRATAYMAIIFFLLAVTLGLYNRPKASAVPFDEDKPVIEAPAAAGIPVAPATLPVGQLPTLNVGNLPPAPAVPAVPAVTVTPANPVVTPAATVVTPAPTVNIGSPVGPIISGVLAEPLVPKAGPAKPEPAKSDATNPVAPVVPEKK